MAEQAAGAHTAIVTGANHGIGAATAVALARRGCAVLCTYLRVEDPEDPGTPPAYGEHRRQDAGPVVAQIQAGGGRAVAVEADLSDPAVPAALFDAAEAELGPVDILVNGVALGTLLRHPAAAIGVLVAVVLVLPGIATALPARIESNVEEYWPTTAGSQVTDVIHGTHDLGPWPGFGLMCLFIAATMAAAFLLLARRDT